MSPIFETVDRFFVPPRGSFFLFGPRGTGKSTFISRSFPGAYRLDLLRPDVFRAYRAKPERLRSVVLGNPGREAFAIDEVQKVPELLAVVHSLIEEKRGWRFILTGSSARTIRRAGVDLLAGRAVSRTLHPFMAAELGPAFELDAALRHGLLPIVLGSADSDDVLRSYAALYVREEVQMEGLVRDIGGFSRFLEAASLSHACVLNISNVARDCGVGRNTVEGFLGVLEDLLLAFRLSPFTRRAKRATVAHPKFYYFDAGVFRSLRPAGALDGPGEIAGQALEGLVAQHLRAWIAYRGGRSTLHYWRTRSGVEVDFVVYGDDGFWGLEVKSTGSVRPGDLRGLRAFRDDYPSARGVLLHRGSERAEVGGILCLPCEDFLRALRPDKALEEAL